MGSPFKGVIGGYTGIYVDYIGVYPNNEVFGPNITI